MDKNQSFDDFIDAEVNRALSPYLGVLPDEAIDEMRSVLRDALMTHPTGSRLARQAAPPPQVMSSGEVVRADVDEVFTSEGKKAQSGGSR